jgi:hypothetical protein
MADVKTKEEEVPAPPPVLETPSQTAQEKKAEKEPILAKEVEDSAKGVPEVPKQSAEKTTESASKSTSHAESKADPLVAQATSQPVKEEKEVPKEFPEEAPDPDEDDLSDLDGNLPSQPHT